MADGTYVVENRGPRLQAVCIFLVTMATTSMLLRCGVRLRLVKAFGWDDASMLIATAMHIMFVTCAICGIKYGTGRHYWDLSDHGIYMAKLYWWLCYIAYGLAMVAAKISIGIFLLRLTVTRTHHLILYTAMFMTIVSSIVFVCVSLFQCTPISFFWNSVYTKDGYCMPIDIIIILTYIYSVISATCDFTFGALPIFLIWNLQMPLKIKIAIIPILSMACVASTAVLVRMAFVKDFKTDDFLYKTVDIAIWSGTEQSLAITAGNLGTLRPLFSYLSHRFGLSSTTKGTSGANTPGTGPGAASGSNNPLSPRSNGGRSSRNRRGPLSFVTTMNATHNDPDEEFHLGLVDAGKKRQDSRSVVEVREDSEESDRNLNSKKKEESSSGYWRKIEIKKPVVASRGASSSEEELNKEGK